MMALAAVLAPGADSATARAAEPRQGCAARFSMTWRTGYAASYEVAVLR